MGQILDMRRTMGSQDVLPKGVVPIKYLRSTGVQYIDTEIYPNTYTKVTCVFLGEFNNKRLFGSRGNGTGDRQFECILYDTSQYGFIFRFANSNNYQFKSEVYNQIFTVEMDASGVVVNNNLIRFGQSPYFTAPRTLLLFAGHFTSGAGDFATLSMFSFKILQNSTLVRDFIPVRKGKTGYMYDKVSGQLFGNAGTGDFVLGPDI